MGILNKFIPQSLGGKLLSVYLTAVGVIVLAFFAILEYQNYQFLKQDLISRLNDFTAHQARVLSKPVWNFSLSSINAIVDAIIKEQNLLYVEIRDDADMILAQYPDGAHISFHPELTQNQKITHTSNNKEHVIGNVIITFHQNELISAVKLRLLSDAIIIIICLVTVALVTISTTRTIIIRPLEELLASIQSTKLNKHPIPVRWKANDEIGHVVNSYNELQEAQSKATEELEGLNATLQEEVIERKRIGEDLRLALIDAERANQAKSEFLATISHELRTPLNAISGFSEMITGQYFGELGSPKYYEYAGDIHASSAHLLQLVNDILDLSAIEAGKQHLDIETFNISEIIADCSPIISSAANRKSVTFNIKYDENVPLFTADRRAVKQILLNILSNAINFTLEEGTVSLEVTATNGSHLIEVIDTGVGIPLDKIKSLTDPFTRVEGNPYITHERTGLGLAIVKSLVELHDGNLNISSTLGEGTTVSVSLPIINNIDQAAPSSF